MIYIEYNEANVACIEFDEPACIECNTFISDPIILMLSALTLMVSKLHTSNLNNLILYLKSGVSLTDSCILLDISYSHNWNWISLKTPRRKYLVQNFSIVDKNTFESKNLESRLIVIFRIKKFYSEMY